VATTTHYVPAFITAGGIVMAAFITAILTGFGAAALKHRWDVRADNVRWERERQERRRDEPKAAFSEY
jgi:hypothetical protein